MKYFIVFALIVAAVAGAPVEEETKTKEKRGILAAAPLLHPSPLALHAAPLALPALHSAPLISAHALPARIISHAPLALPAYHAPLALPALHAPLALPYSLGHGLAYGGYLHH